MSNYTFGENILKLENVSLQLGTEKKQILRDINVQILDVIRPNCVTGQIIGLLGPSGRGKTQLFKIISGLNKPTSGSVLVGADMKEVQPGDVGVVAQNYPLFEHRSVMNNLLMVMNKKLTTAEKTDKINYYLEMFKLTEQIKKYPAQLSGGQRQRIAIIQQLLCSEHFVLLDEPFSGLDPIMTAQACELIQTICNLDEKNTVIVVSHDVYSLLTISQIVWFMGFDFGAEGAVPGAYIKYVENVMDKGFCWQHELMDNPEFIDFLKKSRGVFSNL